MERPRQSRLQGTRKRATSPCRMSTHSVTSSAMASDRRLHSAAAAARATRRRSGLVVSIFVLAVAATSSLATLSTPKEPKTATRATASRISSNGSLPTPNAAPPSCVRTSEKLMRPTLVVMARQSSIQISTTSGETRKRPRIQDARAASRTSFGHCGRMTLSKMPFSANGLRIPSMCCSARTRRAATCCCSTSSNMAWPLALLSCR
eukprot:scaffold5766_cov256-Pinguiococcus_pyrenoidosus.AAC.14